MPTIVVQEVSGDIEAWQFWNSSIGIGHYQDQPPSIALGQLAGMVAFCRNTSAYAQEMRMDAIIADPAGQISTLTGNTLSVRANEVLDWHIRWVCDIEGVYKTTLVLYAGEPGELLSEEDIGRILEWARCGYMLEPAGPSVVGVGCIARAYYGAYGGYGDPRVEANDTIRWAVVDALMAAYGVTNQGLRQLIYYPGSGTGYQIAVLHNPTWEAKRQVMLQINSYCVSNHKECLISGPPPYPEPWYRLDSECCRPYYPALFVKYDELQAESEAFGAIFSDAIELAKERWGYIPAVISFGELLAPYCATAVQDYWDGLDEDTKMSLWIRPRYLECAKALAYLNGEYANLWAPCTIEGLIQHAAIFGTWFDADAARWAAKRLKEYPWG